MHINWLVLVRRGGTRSQRLLSYNGEKKQGSESAVSIDSFLEWNCKLYIDEYV